MSNIDIRLGKIRLGLVDLTLCLFAIFLLGTSSAIAAGDGLERAVEQAARMVVPDGTVVLAASASQEGHWTFVNAKGERFTAASPDEMKRMLGVLASGAKEPETRLVLVLAEDTVFSQGKAFNVLPRSASLRLSTATGVYTLQDGPPRTAQVSPKVRVEIDERAAFDEVLTQLDRSLARGGIRVVALEPSAPAILSARPALDKSGKGDLIERIDPYRLKDALAGLRGQTVLITGRLADGLLNFKVPSGPDRSLIALDLVTAAEQHDVNLIILDATAGRQPGARNWLWLRAELSGADGLTADSGLDALLGTIATETRPLTVRLTKASAERVTMVAVPSVAAASATSSIVDALTRAAAGVSNDVTGRIEPTAIHMYLVSAARRRELDRRLFSSVPSSFTWGYLALVFLGALGSPISWRWWNKLWPPENRGEYASAFGYQAAGAVKLAIYVITVMPATAIVAAPVALLSRLKGAPHAT